MSFRCDYCKESTPPRTPCRLVTVVVRHRPDNGGTEIVKQWKQCPTCYHRTPEAITERMNDGKTYQSALRYERDQVS